MAEDTKSSLLKSVIWTLSNSFGTQIVTLLVSMYLSRLVTPEETGFIAIVTFISAIGQLVIDTGFESSLMRKRNAGNVDYNTVFFYNITMSILVFLIIVFLAPYIADFYNQPKLTNILRVFSLYIILVAFTSVPKVQLEKNFQFKALSINSLIANIIAGVSALIMAYNGFGVWSLVITPLMMYSIVMVYTWSISSWRPKLEFNTTIFKEHFKFGYKISLSTILLQLFNNIYNLIIGKKYSISLLGQFNRANQLTMMIAYSIGGAVNRIALPLFASKTNDLYELKNTYFKVVKMLLFIVGPIATYCVIASNSIIIFLFGHQWEQAVIYFKILAPLSMLYSVNMLALYIINITGRSELGLKADLFKKSISVILIYLATVNGDIFTLIYINILISLIEMCINFKYCTKIIDTTIVEQFKLIFPNIIICFFTFIPLYFLYNLLSIHIQSNFILLLITLPVFVLIYALLSLFIPHSGIKDFLRFTKLEHKMPVFISSRLK